MEKVELIDVGKYFAESKKVIQIAIEREKLLGKKMPITDKLRLIRDYKKKTNSPDEYEALETLEKELDKKLRFNQLNEPAVPDEYKEKVKRNAVVELQEVNKLLNEFKAQLRFHYKYIENEVVPLIANIEKLERLKAIPVQIEAIIDEEIGENAVFKIENTIRELSHSKNMRISKSINSYLSKAIKSMQEIEFAEEFKN
ncbi:hypothetical protein ACFSTH_11695 [Paenibacillus yanchengensis]|uniref:Uncharacterized protein n=1 Tax=Paenibacillus yanchengensis TaxID=2035833 RepID=A0ABW4YR79_9BACL